MTNGQDHEEDTEEMDFSGPGRDDGDAHVRRPRWRDRVATVELAGAGAVRLDRDHLLAGAWAPGAVADSVRRMGRRISRLENGPAHARADGGTLGVDDAGRAEAIPARHPPRTLRIRAPRRRDVGRGAEHECPRHKVSGWPLFSAGGK